MLKINSINTVGGTQARIELNQDVVSEYAELYKSGALMPAITVFYDGSTYWLADGFHRYYGAKSAGLTEIFEEVIPGTKRDAILYSLSANSKHGLRRTNADKRKAVQTLLDDEEWCKWSNESIAKACNVSPHTVASAKNSHSAFAELETDRVYTTKHGTKATMQTENIGKKADVVSESEEYDPKENELQEAHNTVNELAEQNNHLKDLVAVLVPSESEQSAIEIITDLRAQIKTLEAVNAALIASRDTFQTQNAEMMKQMARQRKEIEKLKVK